jgi:tight adherence protein B
MVIPANIANAAFAAFLGVVMTTIGIALTWHWLQERRRSTLMSRQLAEVQNATGASLGLGGLVRSRREESLAPLVLLAQRFGWSEPLQKLLTLGGMNWDIGTFMVITLAAGLGIALFFFLLTGWPMLSLALGLAAGAAPLFFVKYRAKRRIMAFEEKLPEALDLLARAIRAGHPIASGIKMVADEAPQPVAGEFQQTFEEQRFGLPFEDSMLNLAGRVPVVDLRMLVTAVLIQREVGGNLAEVLDNLADVIRQRFIVRRQLRTYTAQGRLSGYVLAALPIVVGCMIFAINGEYAGILFNHPLGKLLMTIAFSMQVIGFLWIRKIVDIDI